MGWQTDVGLVMSALDVLVICSDNEGLPLSAIEAGYNSKVVIGTPVGSMSEIIIDKVSGFITEKNTTNMVETLEYILSNDSILQEMGDFARKRVEKDFSLSNYLVQISRIYTNLVCPRG